ncbi:MAG TPA: TolC family protein [Tepidisphaeraceae bacterium]|jgi:outer membrane protein TolC
MRILAALLVLTGCEDQKPAIELSQVRNVSSLNLAASIPTTQAATPATLPSVAPPKELPISLGEVRQAALVNNLDLKVDLLDPTIAKQSVNEEEAKFEAVFTTDINYSNLNQPAETQLESSHSENLYLSPGISVPLRTGGTITLSYPWNRNVTNNSYNFFPGPFYYQDPQLTILQPLLRGGGVDVAEYSIKIAKLQYQQVEARTKLEVIRVLAEVERYYWAVYAASEHLRVQKQQYNLALAQLNRAKHQVAAGVSAEAEVIRAESGVADQVDNVITADEDLVSAEQNLKMVMNRPDLPMEGPTVLVPSTLPRELYYKLDIPKLADQAVRDRMEMLDTELQIQQDSLTVGFERNDVLPLVDLTYTYDVPGLGPSSQAAFHMVRSTDFQDNTLGLHVEVPIGNEAARARLRRALAQRQQQLATREQRIISIKQDLYTAITEFTESWERMLAARKRVEMDARLLDVQIRQFQQGLQTSTQVLDAQTTLGIAKDQEISAIRDYQIAQVDIAYATGTLLGSSHIRWNSTPINDK